MAELDQKATAFFSTDVTLFFSQTTVFLLYKNPRTQLFFQHMVRSRILLRYVLEFYLRTSTDSVNTALIFWWPCLCRQLAALIRIRS